jgi:hypothetical protein
MVQTDDVRRAHRLLTLCTALALSAWLAAPAVAVTGGDADDNHPFVAAVLWPGAGHPTCSGVWTDIGGHRRAVVTDAHCVPRAAATRVRVFFGARWRSGAHTIPGRSYRHPSYDAHAHRNDVAVILLDADPHVTPARLARAGSAQRRRVTVVGYGSPHAGRRWAASEIVSSWSGWRLYLRPGSGNTCSGDSGGPDLVPGTYQIVALTDEGTCSWDEDTRLDVGSARSFVTGPH